MELVTPGIGLLFWMLLAFSILLIILKKFAWKPIMQSLKEREQTIEEALNAAEKAQKDIAKLTANNELLIKQAKEERDLILKEARQIKEDIIKEAQEKAHLEADSIMKKTKEAIESEKNAAINTLKNQIAYLSIDIAEKILKEELSSEKKQEAYIQQLVDSIKIN